MICISLSQVDTSSAASITDRWQGCNKSAEIENLPAFLYPGRQLKVDWIWFQTALCILFYCLNISSTILVNILSGRVVMVILLTIRILLIRL